VIEAPELDAARWLAAKVSTVCRDKVEVRPLPNE
jgi:hypothetical protein